MIEEKRGDILLSRAKAVVNPVNCVGIMGKGLALAFKEKYPEMDEPYKLACKTKELRPGVCQLWDTGDIAPRYIINFPTKDHWRDPSRLEWIDQGLQHMNWLILMNDITSVAVPPLGCGLGGLSWKDVRPLMYRWLDFKDVMVTLHVP